MSSATRTSPGSAGAVAGPDAPTITTEPGLSLRRLHLMRFGYLVMAVGLAVTTWPLVLQHEGPWPPEEGALTAMLVGLGLLAFVGLRYPVLMLPVLLFESTWKLIWMAAIALPMWASDQMDEATRTMFDAVLWVVLILAVVPWRYVVRQYVTGRGDRWVTGAR